MQISRDCVVRFHYTLKGEDGSVLETSDKSEPMTYLHGHNGLLQGLEDALSDRTTGDSFDVTLTPEQAFGQLQSDSEQRIPIKHLQGAKKWKPGMMAVVNTEQGQRQVSVVKVGHSMATVDTNHPLAGQTVTFSIRVEEVRPATAEEVTHGHAHGPGGHHH